MRVEVCLMLNHNEYMPTILIYSFRIRQICEHKPLASPIAQDCYLSN